VTKVFTWVNSDLDGACSTILLGNLFKNFEYRSIFFGGFEEAFSKWWKDFSDDYDKIFVVGIPLTQQLINKYDDYKIIWVSDIDEKLNVYDSTLVRENTTSCSKLIYKKFKDKVEYPLEIKKLVAYIDDYNSYELKHEESVYLNAFFRKLGFDKFNKFVKRFWKGFDGFTTKEANLAGEFLKDIDNELESLTLYEGEFKGSKVLATFSKCAVNEIAKGILDNYETDVAMIVNTDTQYVSFRKSKDSKADLKFIAENLCDGGGSENASGGKMTQKFIEFTTKLKEK
jgi:hypothetical protein